MNTIIFMLPAGLGILQQLTARWIFPVEQLPLARGTITIQGDRILSVDKAGTRTADIDLGNVAILPGFVNAHTHLDLSDALGQCPPTPTSPPGSAVIAFRRHRRKSRGRNRFKSSRHGNLCRRSDFADDHCVIASSISVFVPL